MLRKGVTLILLLCGLFSGQIAAKHSGHPYWWVQNADRVLRHEADSDELRSAAEEAAESLREHHAWHKSRKPETHFR